MEIKQLEEKKWIMVYYFKTHRKKPGGIPYINMLTQWEKWWLSDFATSGGHKIRISSDGQLVANTKKETAKVNRFFTRLCTDLNKIYSSMSCEEVLEERIRQMDSGIPQELAERARRLGYAIRGTYKKSNLYKVTYLYDVYMPGGQVIASGKKLRSIKAFIDSAEEQTAENIKLEQKGEENGNI